MNRRHFFAVTLPALLGAATPRLFAQAKPVAKPSPRRIKIEVDLLKSALTLGDTNAQSILIVTDEDVEVYANFIQMYTYKIKDDQSTNQAFGPYLRVTPHVEPNGEIALVGKLQFEEAASGAVPGEPLPVRSTSLAFTRMVESGHSMTIGALAMGDTQRQVQLTATVLAPNQRD